MDAGFHLGFAEEMGFETRVHHSPRSCRTWTKPLSFYTSICLMSLAFVAKGSCSSTFLFGNNLIRSVPFLQTLESYFYIRERPCENAARKWPSASQEERSHQKPTMLVPWSQIFASRTVRKTNKFLSFMPSILRYFAMAAQADSDST